MLGCAVDCLEIGAGGGVCRPRSFFRKGHFVGVTLDEPVGDSDGTHGGTKYFNAQMKYGAFVKPLSVEVGDFPELGLDSSISDL